MRAGIWLWHPPLEMNSKIVDCGPISDCRWIKAWSVNGLFGWQMEEWSGWWIAITRRWRGGSQLMGSINRAPTLPAPDLLNSRTHTLADWWWNTMAVRGPINVTSVTTPPYIHLIWGITRKESTRRSQWSELPINGEYKSCSGHCPDSTYWIVARHILSGPPWSDLF